MIYFLVFWQLFCLDPLFEISMDHKLSLKISFKLTILPNNFKNPNLDLKHDFQMSLNIKDKRRFKFKLYNYETEFDATKSKMMSELKLNSVRLNKIQV